MNICHDILHNGRKEVLTKMNTDFDHGKFVKYNTIF